MIGSTGKKIAGIVGALVIACAAVLAVCSPMINPKANEEPADAAPIQSTSFVMEEPASEAAHGISILSEEIPLDGFEDYGIAPQAESAKVLTAIYEPSSANVPPSWSISWDTSYSSGGWQNGKAVSNYVTLSTHINTATLTCLQPFGHRIVVEVTAEGAGGTSFSASVKGNYVKQLDERNTLIGRLGEFWEYGEVYSVLYLYEEWGLPGVVPAWGVGTITPELIYGRYDSELKQRMTLLPYVTFIDALNTQTVYDFGGISSLPEYALNDPSLPNLGSEYFPFFLLNLGYVHPNDQFQILKGLVAACKISTSCILTIDILLRYNGKDIRTITKYKDVTLDYSALERKLNSFSSRVGDA